MTDVLLPDKTPFFQLLKQVTFDYWFMLLLVFLMKTGQFMLLPYLALHLMHTTAASTALIGFVIGVGPLAYGLFGPLSGYLIDRFGRRSAIIASIFFAGVVFIIFNLKTSIEYYAVMNLIVGLTRSVFDTASRSYKLHLMNFEQRRFSFSLRFTVTNAGAGLGPLIGMFFIQSNANLLFIVNGIIFIIFSVLIFYFAKGLDDFSQELKPPGMFQVFKAIVFDWRLCAVVLAALLMWTSYAQVDSIFAIYLVKAFHNGAKILTWVFVVNTLACFLLQIPIARVMHVFSEKGQIILGSSSYIIGFLLIPFTSATAVILGASLLVAVGEVIIVPLMDALIYTIAPKNMTGSYYGALGVSVLGFAIGPIIGGYFYQYSNITLLFLFCVGLFVLMALLLWSAVRLSRIRFQSKR